MREREAEPAAPQAAPVRGGGTGRAPALREAMGNRAFARMVARAPTALERDTAAAGAISSSTSWGNLDETGLAKQLLAALLGGDSLLVHDTFDALSKSDRDDVAYEFANAATDAELTRIAKSEKGREALRRVVREILAGWSTGEENKQMRRLMAIVSEEVPQVDDGKGGKTIEIQVVTFDKGGAAMDWMGQNLADKVWWAMAWRSDDRRAQFGEGARGHTAIIVGDLAYTYEGSGWRVGENAVEYMTKATAERDATAQVLLLPIEDARKIKRHLDAAANTGIYLLGGEICSDATGTALEEALGAFDKNANPQSLKMQLAAKGVVASRRYYAQGSNGKPSAKP